MVVFGAFIVVIARSSGEGQEHAARVRIAIIGGAFVLIVTIEKGVISGDNTKTSGTNRVDGAFVSVIAGGAVQAGGHRTFL